MSEYRKFSDFANPWEGSPLEGDKCKIDDILNLEILLTAYRITKSKKNEGDCLTLQFEHNGQKRVIFTGSDVLRTQVERYKDNLPFITRIVKKDKYFTLS